jgi:hypothetical protein
MLRLAEDWRQQMRLDKAEKADSTLVVRVPASIREYLDHYCYEHGVVLSDVVRAAVLDWVLAESTPNLQARRQWLEGLAAIHSTDQDWADDAIDELFDADSPETRRLAEFVRRGEADWARFDRRAMDARRKRRNTELLIDELATKVVHDVPGAAGLRSEDLLRAWLADRGLHTSSIETIEQLIETVQFKLSQGADPDKAEGES